MPTGLPQQSPFKPHDYDLDATLAAESNPSCDVAAILCDPNTFLANGRPIDEVKGKRSSERVYDEAGTLREQVELGSV